MLIYSYLQFSIQLFVFMCLSHLNFFWRVANVKSINQLINLSFRPLALCIHLSCWPLIFFEIKLLSFLSSFSSISNLCLISVSFHTISLSSPFQPSSRPCAIRWQVLSAAEGHCNAFPLPLLEFSRLGELPWPPGDRSLFL